MRAFGCPSCGQLVFFENSVCLRCGTELGFDSGALEIVAVDPAVHARCADAARVGCNWLVPAAEAGNRCTSCQLTRTRPADTDATGLLAWAEVEGAKRRLVHQLLDLGLPTEGLAFDLLASHDGPVTTGHAGGVVTLDLAEADPARREQVRRELGEPYRTVLGHLRHEVGHFQWLALVDAPGGHDAFRAAFGDERDDYRAALDRHYAVGASAGWEERHVSAYATSHPWEDWAETFAHLLHILDSVQTAGAHGVVITGPREASAPSLAATPGRGGPDRPFDEVLAEWLPLTFALNAINRSMGADDLYPFVLAEAVVAKLRFVHDLVRAHGRATAFMTGKQSRHTTPPESGATVPWTTYASPGCHDEMLDDHGVPRPGCEGVVEHLRRLGTDLLERQQAADLAVKAMGITFTVYDESGGNIDRPWPFDVIPRVIATDEWARISDGLVQRLEALNLFIGDLYGDQKIIADGVFPASLLADSTNFREQCVGIEPPNGTWAHICGSDLVRDADGTVYVLEDNLRVPSGVSYMLENRQVTKRVLADLFRDLDVHPIDGYPRQLHDMLADLTPRPGEMPVICVLTPGVHNSAYFEHAYLAQQMGAHLVEGSDLVVDTEDVVHMRTVGGLVRVDVVYRRVDDLFLDPEAFRPDSTLGVRGLMRAWRAGTVAIANAPGAGVADDKVVYAYVPEIIRYYLDEEPKIDNVPTYRCFDPGERAYVLEHLEELVVKPANESGGYGVFIGPRSTPEGRAAVRAQVEADPRNWVAQPTLQLSTAPTLIDGEVVPRHLDLRPFILSGRRPYVTQGGLTRVALPEGSLVVNSSQGGGSKDTWIIDPSVVKVA